MGGQGGDQLVVVADALAVDVGDDRLAPQALAVGVGAVAHVDGHGPDQIGAGGQAQVLGVVLVEVGQAFDAEFLQHVEAVALAGDEVGAGHAALGGRTRGQGREGDLKGGGLGLAGAHHFQGDVGARGEGRDAVAQLPGGADGLARDGGDHVAGYQAGIRTRAADDGVGHEHAAGLGRQAQGLGHVAGQLADDHREVAAGHGAGLNDLVGHLGGDLHGDGEAQPQKAACAFNAGVGRAAGTRADGEVHAHHPAVDVGEGPAGVAGVDGGVGLDVGLVAAGGVE